MDSKTPLLWQTPTRWYAAELTQDLLGDWVVWCYWGSRHSRQGGARCYLVADESTGRRQLQQIAVRRQRRRYVQV